MKEDWEYILIPYAGANLHHIQVGKLEGVIRVSEDSLSKYTLTIRDDITSDNHVYQEVFKDLEKAKEAFKTYQYDILGIPRDSGII